MAILEVQNVSRRFGGLTAVSNVSFSVEKGEILGVIGPNGAGKTTLFSLISGFLPPNGGDVVFKGQSIVGQPPHRIAKRGLTRSFQVVQVFTDMTVLDAVTTAALLNHPMRAAIAKAEKVIDQVGLGHKALETPASLSLQDKKLLEVAKCVATEPELILLDEVMAGLTLAETQAPLKVIRDLRDAGMTFVMVEHVMPVIMSAADRMVVISFGQKVAEGSPAEIVADEKVREAYFGEEDLHD
ncbi:MAG: ABC transporter ATP-binding protein [Magnetospirillum sp.]